MYGLCGSIAVQDMFGTHTFMTWFGSTLVVVEWTSLATTSVDDPKVIATIDSLPVETHPMTQLSVAMLALQKDSKFFKTRGQWLPEKDLDHHLPTQKNMTSYAVGS